MGIISFKNVGIKEFQVQNVLTTPTSVLPIGIKTPVDFGSNGEGLFAMYTNIQDVVNDNLRNLLTTNFGDRVIRYNFGANLKPLVAEFTSKEDFDPEAMLRIKTATANFMPFVNLVGFDSSPEYSNQNFTGKITVTVTYSVPALNMVEQGLQLLLSVI
jgi:phage baseplate assembly protein W